MRLVREELEQTTGRRAELWREHGDSSDLRVAADVDRLSRRIEALWDEARMLTAEIRHGARADIIARARQTERVERDLRRRQRSGPSEALAR